jgi:hypothetical protein
VDAPGPLENFRAVSDEELQNLPDEILAQIITVARLKNSR